MALVDPSGVVVGLLDWDVAKTFTPPPGHTLREAGDARVGDFGVIPNTALVSPVTPGVINLFASNFTIPTTYAEILGVDLVVPANCGSLLVNAVTWVHATNNSTTQGTLAVNTNVNGGSGWSNGVTYTETVAVGSSGTVSAPVAALIGSLISGGTIRLSASREVPVAPAWTADAFNVATLTATLLWLR